MSSYLVLARKYRPRKFEDLIGQSQVSHTLTRALEVGRLAHAYLFTGPRGVGKTTAARLLAMALSCQGTGTRPCGACQACLEIQNGQAVDVVEVDGASNRGIDEIRSLRETVKYLPVKNPRKVYIIDEVHALTKDAFNALLKTLEEPPAHVIFIFATTEAHRLPATILSRCQRYDFRRIKVDDIVGRLIDVAQAEEISAARDALTVIARQAEGGLRDALGLMDQVIASSGEITLEAVNMALGLINQDLVLKTAASALKGDLAGAMDVLDEAYGLGYDFKELGLRTLELVRNLTLFKAAPAASESLDLTDAEEARYKALTADLSLGTLHRHLESWLRFQNELARHTQPRWLMESYLIRLCQMAPLADLGALAERLVAFLESGAAPKAAQPGHPPRSLDSPLALARDLAPGPAQGKAIPTTVKPMGDEPHASPGSQGQAVATTDKPMGDEPHASPGSQGQAAGIEAIGATSLAPGTGQAAIAAPPVLPQAGAALGPPQAGPSPSPPQERPGWPRAEEPGPTSPARPGWPQAPGPVLGPARADGDTHGQRSAQNGSQAPDPTERLRIMEEMPAILELHKALPGNFIGYFAPPLGELPQDDVLDDDGNVGIVETETAVPDEPGPEEE
ncbi:MAG: DNA polymerase III subunit gamma/tau [Deltaproteobacteria bacterium]|nr:DNA polymerase III subunit gamma/tau [Deltaproteobacteria bacterium]